MQSKTLTALAVALAAAHAHADDAVRLDEVVVTASRVPEALKDQAANITVISAEDIANSSARTVQDLLSTVAGVHVFNNSGSPQRATVDLRGFGMTASSNTLILVDGVKQNANDQSSPNLGGIPLDQIERIEVVRGSSAVQYGGGATGGVINIITRSGFKARDTLRVGVTAGSYNLKQLDVAGHVASQQVALDAYVQSMKSDNYRDNNAERNDSGGLDLSLRHDSGDLRLYARHTNQDLRLPGARKVDPATGQDQYHDDPRGASTPNDYADLKADSYGLQAKQELGRGMLYLDLGVRDQKTLSYQWGGLDQRQLDETNGSLRYEQPLGAHRLVVGVDTLRSDTDVDSLWLGASRIKQRQLGGFADLRLKPWGGGAVTVGGRTQRVEDETTSLPVGSVKESNKELHAWQLGLRQQLSDTWSVYASLGQSFRVPNSDDQYGLTTALKPQTSHDKEVGAEWQQAGRSLRAAWFRYDLVDEIHYNQLAFSNVNLDPTRHQGVELEGRVVLTPRWELNANLTWQQATFRSGHAGGVELAGNDVPLVPNWLANVGVAWLPQDATRVGVQLQYVGEQRMDNDQANQFGTKLDAYTVVNAKLSHGFGKQLDAALSVNNLFDKRYATYGARSGSTGSSGVYNVYPAAGRNVQATLSYRY